MEDKKEINRLFLGIILIHCFAVCLLMYFGNRIKLDIIQNLLLSELMILLPGFIYLWIYGKKIKKVGNLCAEEQTKSVAERLHFNKIKVSTFFMVILFTFMIMPLTSLANAVSMLFVDNTVLTISTDVLTKPFILMFFLISIYGPFCEELVFRGIIYGGYRQMGNTFMAILLSGFLFGLMHMNFNQAGYAFIMGICLALLMEVTGSIISSMLCHFIFNAESVCLLYICYRFMPEIYEQESNLQGLAREQLYLTISVYFVFAAITTAIAICILIWIAKNEGRVEYLKRAMPFFKKKRKNLWSISLVIGVAISIIYMIFDAILSMGY